MAVLLALGAAAGLAALCVLIALGEERLSRPPQRLAREAALRRAVREDLAMQHAREEQQDGGR